MLCTVLYTSRESHYLPLTYHSVLLLTLRGTILFEYLYMLYKCIHYFYDIFFIYTSSAFSYSWASTFLWPCVFVKMTQCRRSNPTSHSSCIQNTGGAVSGFGVKMERQKYTFCFNASKVCSCILTVQTFAMHTLTHTHPHRKSPEHVLCPSSMQEGELFSRIQARGDQAFTEKGNLLNTKSAPKIKTLLVLMVLPLLLVR